MPADDLTVSPDYVFEEEPKFSTAVSKFENGTEQRRALWSTPLRTFKLQYRNRSSADYSAVLSLLTTKLGQYTSFLWTNPNDSVQYTVRFSEDSIGFKNKAFGIYDFEFSLVQVK